MSSNVIDIAKNQFKERLNAGLQVIEVPEWSDENGIPLKIYYKPALNLKQQQKVLELSAQNKVSEAIAMTLVLRSLDEEGTSMFKQANMPEIMRDMDPDVVARIVSVMTQEDLTVDQIEKN